MHLLKSDYLGSGQEQQNAAQVQTAVELDRVARWIVYRRLQELGILCDCGCDRPLTIAISTPADALLIWSVVRGVTLPKPSLTDHLERCWQQRNPR